MVNPDSAQNVAGTIISILPPEIAKQLVTLVQAIGGLFILYLIFLGIKLYMQRKELKLIKEMNEDIKKIKKRLKIK